MDELAKNLHQIWENRPQVIVLLILGFIVFVFIVVDAWRHKRHRKRPR